MEKPEGTKVTYFIFPENEIHSIELPSGSVQDWHHHQTLDESIVITEGSIRVRWVEDGQIHQVDLEPGDIARVGVSKHTLENVRTYPARALVFRFISDGSDKRAAIRDDKVVDLPWELTTDSRDYGN